MDDQPLTLSAICSVTHDEATNAILAGAENRVWEDLGLPRWLWKEAAGRAARYVDQLLGMPLETVLTNGWNTYRKYYKYTDAKKYPAEKEYEEKAMAFAVDTTNTPRLDLQVNGTTIASLQFPITLSFKFSGATIVIRNGRFQALKTGTCTLSGKICCEKAVLKEYQSRPVVLPGILTFKGGIPIRPG